MQKKGSYQNPDSNNNSVIASNTGHNSRQSEQRALLVPSSPNNFTMDKKSSMNKPPQPKTKTFMMSSTQMSSTKQPKPLGAFHSGSALKLPGTSTANLTHVSVPSLHSTKNRNQSSNKI
jgi:hypothetical protein